MLREKLVHGDQIVSARSQGVENIKVVAQPRFDLSIQNAAQIAVSDSAGHSTLAVGDYKDVVPGVNTTYPNDNSEQHLVPVTGVFTATR